MEKWKIDADLEDYKDFLKKPSLTDIIEILNDFPQNYRLEIVNRNFELFKKRLEILIENYIKPAMRKIVKLSPQEQVVYKALIISYYEPILKHFLNNLNRLALLQQVISNKKSKNYIFLKEKALSASIVDVAETLGLNPQKTGKVYKCLCPFHNDTDPSLVLFPETNTFFCFGCGIHGDVINLYKSITGKTFTEALEDLTCL